MLKKILIWVFVFVVALLMLLWSFSPLIVRTAANTVLAPNQLQLSDETHVRINPFAFVVEIEDFSLVHGKTPLVSFEHLYMDIDPIKLLWKQASVSKLDLNGLWADVEQNGEKIYLNQVDVLALFENQSSQQLEQTDETPNDSDAGEDKQTSAPYSLLVNNISLEDFKITFKHSEAQIDSSLKSLFVNQIKGGMDNLSVDINFELDVNAAVNDMNVKSTIEFQTQVVMTAQQTVSIDVSDTDLKIMDVEVVAAGYQVEQKLLKVSSKQISLVTDDNGPQVKGNAAFSLEDISISPLDATQTASDNKTLTLASVSIPDIVIEQADVPQIKIETIGVSKLDLMVPKTDEVTEPNLLSVQSLDLGPILLSQEQLAITLINLGKVDVNAKILSDKSLTPLFVAAGADSSADEEAQETESSESTPAPTSESNAEEQSVASKFAIKLDEFTLAEQMDVFFEDNSVAPEFKTHLYLNQVSLTDIDSHSPDTVANLVVRGGMDEYTKFALDGQLQAFLPQQKYVFKGDVKELSLPELSPYVDQALGYVIETGVLNNEFDIAIEGNLVDGESRSLLQAIDLTAVEQDGEKNGLSGGAISLNMALNTLKDGDGNVELDVPISGDLNNPSIGVSGVVALIVKQATMSAAKDYLITTFLPYSQVVKIALSASDTLLKMSFEPMPYELVDADLNETQKSYLAQLAEVLKAQEDIKVKICPIAAKGTEKTAAKDKLVQAKATGAKVKQYLVQQQGVQSERLFSCAAALDEEGKGRVEFQQL